MLLAAALGLAASKLTLVIFPPEAREVIPSASLQQASTTTILSVAEARPSIDINRLQDWPAAFGTARPDFDQAASTPVEPASTFSVSTDYILRGTAIAPDGSWAMIYDGTAEIIVRVGDQLSSGEIVTLIGPNEVTLESAGGQLLIVFQEGQETVSMPPQDEPQEIDTWDVSFDDDVTFQSSLY